MLDRGLQFKADPRQGEIGRFRAQRVGLAVELLAEKIEAPAHRAALGEQFLRRDDMRESRSSSSRMSPLAISSAASSARRSGGQRRRRVEKLRQRLDETRLERLRLRRGAVFGGGDELGDLRQPGLQHGDQALALGRAHGRKRLERRREARQERRLPTLAARLVLALLAALEHAAQGQKPIGARRRRLALGDEFLRQRNHCAKASRLTRKPPPPPVLTRPSITDTAPRFSRCAIPARSGSSSDSNPGGRRKRRSSDLLLTLLTSQTQETPSSCPSLRANPVMLETVTRSYPLDEQLKGL